MYFCVFMLCMYIYVIRSIYAMSGKTRQGLRLSPTSLQASPIYTYNIYIYIYIYIYIVCKHHL